MRENDLMILITDIDILIAFETQFSLSVFMPTDISDIYACILHSRKDRTNSKSNKKI